MLRSGEEDLKKKTTSIFHFLLQNYLQLVWRGGGVIKFPVSDFLTPENVTYQTYNVMHNARQKTRDSNLYMKQ